MDIYQGVPWHILSTPVNGSFSFFLSFCLSFFLFSFFLNSVYFSVFVPPTFPRLPPSIWSRGGKGILDSVGQLAIWVPGVTWATLHPSLRNRKKPTNKSVTIDFPADLHCNYRCTYYMFLTLSQWVSSIFVLKLTHESETNFQICLFASLMCSVDKLCRWAGHKR